MKIHYYLEILGGNKAFMKSFLTGMFIYAFTYIIKDIILLPVDIISGLTLHVNSFEMWGSFGIIFIFSFVSDKSILFDSDNDMRFNMLITLVMYILGYLFS